MSELFDAAWASRQLANVGSAALGIFVEIVHSEGGYSNRAADRGGPTNYGVTLKTARTYGTSFDYDGDGVVSIADLQKITPLIAQGFYAYAYYLLPKINLLSLPVQAVVTDISVNMGQGTAAELTQLSLNYLQPAAKLGEKIGVDHKLGPASALLCAQIVSRLGAAMVVNTICDQRETRYQSIVAHDPSQEANLNGWNNRAERYRMAA